jgi:hypothetical protein
MTKLFQEKIKERIQTTMPGSDDGRAISLNADQSPAPSTRAAARKDVQIVRPEKFGYSLLPADGRTAP